MAFELHPRLEADSFPIGTLKHTMVRLSGDARYRWLLAIPRVEDCREWHMLPENIAHGVLDETLALSRWLETYAQADKMNIAALGNQVPQLHIHIIARHNGDPAWPGPIWGMGDAVAYEESARLSFIADICAAFSFRPV